MSISILKEPSIPGDESYGFDEWLREGVTAEMAASKEGQWVCRNPFPNAE